MDANGSLSSGAPVLALSGKGPDAGKIGGLGVLGKG
jgi:hypothetical protein